MEADVRLNPNVSFFAIGILSLLRVFVVLVTNSSGLTYGFCFYDAFVVGKVMGICGFWYDLLWCLLQIIMRGYEVLTVTPFL